MNARRFSFLVSRSSFVVRRSLFVVQRIRFPAYGFCTISGNELDLQLQKPEVSKAEFFDKRQIVLFDGVCNLCNGFVNFIIRRDKNARFKFASLQSEVAKKFIADFQIDELKADSVIYIRNDKVYLHSTAALYILKDMGFPWKLTSVFLLFPKFLLDPVYNLVARTRYRIFGKRESCMVPTNEVRDRFLG